jgi:hypothetical protein
MVDQAPMIISANVGLSFNSRHVAASRRMSKGANKRHLIRGEITVVAA